MNSLQTDFSNIPWHAVGVAMLISIGAVLAWYALRRGFLALCRQWQAQVIPRLLKLYAQIGLTRLLPPTSNDDADSAHTLAAKELHTKTWQTRFHQGLWYTLHIVFWATSVIWGFIALTAVLALFPSTQNMSESLLQIIWNTVSPVFVLIGGAIPGLCVTLIVVLLARLLIRSSNRFFKGVTQQEIATKLVHSETAAATQVIVNLLIVLFALALVYPFLPGSGSDVFKGISLLFGFMITLGSTGVLSQMMSGLVLIYARSLRIGDYVTINQDEGVVSEIGLLAVKIVNIRNKEITIPHAILVAHPIHNFSRKAEQYGSILSTKLSIGYDVDWRVVHQLTLAAAANSPIRKEPKPFVLQRSLSDFYVEYELVFSVDNPIENLKILSTLHANILDEFNRAGVQIMSPHFMAQPDQAVVARPPE